MKSAKAIAFLASLSGEFRADQVKTAIAKKAAPKSCPMYFMGSLTVSPYNSKSFSGKNTKARPKTREIIEVIIKRALIFVTYLQFRF